MKRGWDSIGAAYVFGPSSAKTFRSKRFESGCQQAKTITQIVPTLSKPRLVSSPEQKGFPGHSDSLHERRSDDDTATEKLAKVKDERVGKDRFRASQEHGGEGADDRSHLWEMGTVNLCHTRRRNHMGQENAYILAYGLILASGIIRAQHSRG